MTVKKVALAYSGGLDTSVIIPWLKENYGCDVVAVAVDVGQADETSGLAEKAYQTGACDFRLVEAGSAAVPSKSTTLVTVITARAMTAPPFGCGLRWAFRRPDLDVSW